MSDELEIDGIVRLNLLEFDGVDIVPAFIIRDRRTGAEYEGLDEPSTLVATGSAEFRLMSTALKIDPDDKSVFGAKPAAFHVICRVCCRSAADAQTLRDAITGHMNGTVTGTPLRDLAALQVASS